MNERQTKVVLEYVEVGGDMVFTVRGRRWMKSHETEMRVSNWGLVATGDLGGYKRGMLRIPWARIAELHYGLEGGAARSVQGLYVREGEWCSRCVLPYVSEQQADQVIAAVAQQYPQVMGSLEGMLSAAASELLVAPATGHPGGLPLFGHRGVSVAPSGRL